MPEPPAGDPINSETAEQEIAIMKRGLEPYRSATIKLKYSTINAGADKLTTAEYGASHSSIAIAWLRPIGSVSGRRSMVKNKPAPSVSRTTARLLSPACGTDGRIQRPEELWVATKKRESSRLDESATVETMSEDTDGSSARGTSVWLAVNYRVAELTGPQRSSILSV